MPKKTINIIRDNKSSGSKMPASVLHPEILVGESKPKSESKVAKSKMKTNKKNINKKKNKKK